MAVRAVETSDPTETEALGAELARKLGRGDVVLVRGDLGTGKTTFVRGAARALGVTDPITSPTFSIGHRYRGDGVMVSHIDLYRLAGLEGEDPALLADHLNPGSIAFIEWPEAADAQLDGRRVEVTLAHAGGDKRRIELHEPEQAHDVAEPDGAAAARGSAFAAPGLGLDGGMAFDAPTEPEVEGA